MKKSKKALGDAVIKAALKTDAAWRKRTGPGAYDRWCRACEAEAAAVAAYRKAK